MGYDPEYDKDKYKTLGQKVRDALFNNLVMNHRENLAGTVMNLPDEVLEEMMDTWLEIAEKIIEEHTGTEPIPEEYLKQFPWHQKYLRDIK